ncbi:hypothetical protein A7985_22660 [Pseudoalteromonas luteoviolacea]|uniref:ATP-binding protein n=1 Tax=Pseudoalteromonas luteoviolacea TaxID=43657 RepID=A0A1C0TKG7_9GAMM|nr:ATP-binding protein [Pseudoalteromonas luteoviolacea]OCQ18821.1 hypothetical protein A7985_22660 [Pseudoalteromonas luteoviolacea]
MKLIITDNLESNRISVTFSDEQQVISYHIDDFEMPSSKNFTRATSECYGPFLYGEKCEFKGDNTAANIIQFGHKLGDSLLGEQFELNAIREIIEEVGYQHLEIKIVSDDATFHAQLWESIILPGSNYVLSTVAKRFSRVTRSDAAAEESADHWALNVTSALTQEMQAMQSGGQAPEPQNDPLNVLHLIARPENAPFGDIESYMLPRQAFEHCGGRSIAITSCSLDSVESLSNAIAAQAGKVHVVHIDLPIMLDGDTFQIMLNNGQTVAWDTLLQHISQLAPSLLIIEPLTASSEITKHHLTYTANKAMALGMPNVIGFAEKTDVSVAAECLDEVYRKIAQGFELGQAVVESRKTLQQNNSIHRFTEAPLTLQYWPLLVLYSHKDVTFFASPQEFPGPGEGGFATAHLNNLYGFDLQGWRLLQTPWQQTAAHQILNRYQNDGGNNSVLLHGPSGLGKTATAYTLAFTALKNHSVENVFYFDYLVHNYSLEDVKHMVTSVVKFEEGAAKNLFIFDHVSLSSNNTQLHALLEYLEQYQQYSLVISSSSCVSNEAFSQLEQFECVKARPLSDRQFKHWFALQNCTDSFTEYFLEPTRLHKDVNHNLWLIARLNAWSQGCASHYEVESLVNSIDFTSTLSVEEQYLSYQWNSLEPASQKLLQCLANEHNLILDMLQVSADGSGKDSAYHALCKHLDIPHQPFATHLNNWLERGFVDTQPLGRMLTARAKYWLNNDLSGPESAVLPKVIPVYSQWICEALNMVSKHVSAKENQQLMRYLINERGSWAKHMEVLWTNRDLAEFIQVKQSFDAILHKVGLAEESYLWCKKLIDESPELFPTDEYSDQQTYIWLSVLLSAMKGTEGTLELSEEFVQAWGQWIKEATAVSPLFSIVCRVLEVECHRQQQWEQFVSVFSIAMAHYQEEKLWADFVHTAKVVSSCYFKMGDVTRSREVEDAVLALVPFNEAPADFKTNAYIDIAANRIIREEYDCAQGLLDEVANSNASDRYTALIEGLQSDIHYATQQYEKALPYFCKLWERQHLMGQHERMQDDALQQRLHSISEAIGHDKFTALSRQYLAQDTPTPTF